MTQTLSMIQMLGNPLLHHVHCFRPTLAFACSRCHPHVQTCQDVHRVTLLLTAPLSRSTNPKAFTQICELRTQKPEEKTNPASSHLQLLPSSTNPASAIFNEPRIQLLPSAFNCELRLRISIPIAELRSFNRALPSQLLGGTMNSKDRKKLALEYFVEEEKTDLQLAKLLGEYADSLLHKQPRRTSILSGHRWVQEVLSGNDAVCRENFRVEKHIFHLLCSKLVEHGLTVSSHVGIEEMVAMFLYTVGYGVSTRLVQERFQHSGETVHRMFHAVLRACISLSGEVIRPLDPQFSTCHPRIGSSTRFWPYFQDAIGAIDGTHIKRVVPRSELDKYIGRKGYPTQNVLAVCDWDMCFTFVLAGWEGTVHDARILDDAISTPSMNFPHPPPGKYYLVDSGFRTTAGYLGPYRRERYHIPDFRRRMTFENMNEIFNYHHSSLRTTIERAFGVWKKTFTIVNNMPRYSFEDQVFIVCATMAIHNVIRRNSQVDEESDEVESDPDDNDPEPEASSSTAPSGTEMNELRDYIRDQLARDYM